MYFLVQQSSAFPRRALQRTVQYLVPLITLQPACALSLATPHLLLSAVAAPLAMTTETATLRDFGPILPRLANVRHRNSISSYPLLL